MEDNDNHVGEHIIKVFFYTPLKEDIGQEVKCIAGQRFTSASTNELSHEDTVDSKRVVEETPPLPVREVAVSTCDEEVVVKAAFGVPSKELNRVAEWDILPQNLSDEEVILAPGEDSEDHKYAALELEFERSGAAEDIVYAQLIIRDFIPDDVMFDYIFRLNTTTGDREQKVRLKLQDEDCQHKSEDRATTSNKNPTDDEYGSSETTTEKTQDKGRLFLVSLGKGEEAWTIVWTLTGILSVVVLVVVALVAVVLMLLYRKASFRNTKHSTSAVLRMTYASSRPESMSLIQNQSTRL